MSKVFLLLFFLSILVSPSAKAGGFGPEEPSPLAPTKENAEEKKALKKVDDQCEPVTTKTDDCASGNHVVNHGPMDKGGDSVTTKIVCACEPKECKPVACKPKEVVRYVKSPPKVKIVEKVVERKVAGPIRYVDKIKYIERPAKVATPVETADKNDKGGNGFSVGVLAGIGPDGVHPYKYGDEYRARVGKGVLMGLDVNYRFADYYNVGALYINNDTTMGRFSISF